jgi:peptidoglycan/LPS O-acetylase OafA/YrhL
MHAPQVSTTDRTDYRSDIDGLRAIAVLSVLAYHYGLTLPGWLQIPGGFTGVDVFFVISGFLITSILQSEIAAGQFSVLGFYTRRIRRIVPALLVMLGAVLLAGKFLLMPGDYSALAGSADYATFGLSNFFFLGHTGYFDQSAGLLPLLHTWSLAVEEQFYVVWPIALFALLRGRSRNELAVIVGFIVVVAGGFIESLIWFDQDPKAAFFLATPRAWELALGAALVFLQPLSRVRGEVATVFGLTLIGAGFWTTTAASFPGFKALYPCVGAALIIWPRRAATMSGKWLSYLSPIGLISYSLYLWHWPVWVLFRVYINGGMPRIRETLALALLSLAIATLSYFFVERPLRKPRWRPVLQVALGLTACFLVFGAATYIEHAEGFPERVSKNAVAMRSREAMWNWTCPETVTLEGNNYCAFGGPWQTSRKGILWGDSHAQHLAPIIDAVAKQQGISFILDDVCPAALGDHVHRQWNDQPKYQALCSSRRAETLNILNQQDVEFVVLAAAWSTLATDNLYADDLRQSQDKTALMISGVADAIAQIKRLGRKIIIVTNMTGPGTILTDCVISSESRILRRGCSDDQIKIDANEKRAILGPIDRALAALVQPGVTLVRPIDKMCGEIECVSRVNGEFIWMDYSHVRRNLMPATDLALAKMLGFDTAIK